MRTPNSPQSPDHMKTKTDAEIMQIATAKAELLIPNFTAYEKDLFILGYKKSYNDQVLLPLVLTEDKG